MHFQRECLSFTGYRESTKRQRLKHYTAAITAVLAVFFILPTIGGVSYAQVDPSIRIPFNHPSDISSLIPNAVSATRPITLHITLKLRNRAGLKKLLREQQERSSPEYRHWLQPGEFMSRFGPSPSEVAAVEKWLSGEGFKVSGGSSTILKAQGTVGTAAKAFGISFLGSADGRIYANDKDPAIPARFANVISSIGGLDNLMAASPAARISGTTSVILPGGKTASDLAAPGEAGSGQFSSQPQGYYEGMSAFSPSDFYTFYDEIPLQNSGIKGNTADCIAVVEDSDFPTSAIAQFDSIFSLPAASVTKDFVNNNSSPGYNGDESEALLDVEWAHAVASDAPIIAYIGLPVVYVNGVQESGLLDAANAAVQQNQCGTISISFGFCGGSSTFYTQTINQLAEQAASQGQSVFVSSGDWGAAGLVFSKKKNACVVGSSRHVNELAADPYVTAVGGTQFTPNYDNSGNDVGSVSESVWNETAILNGKKVHIGASGGGHSRFFYRPSYQVGEGVPYSRMRVLPDISIGAGVLKPGFFVVAPDYNGVLALEQAGGTSIGAPMWAGIANLIGQVEVNNSRNPRVGNVNPRLYLMGQQTNESTTGVRDVTSGNNSFHSVTGFPARLGYDLSTGWGTVDIGEFVPAFVTGNFVTVAGDLRAYPHRRHFPRQQFSSVGTTSEVRRVWIRNHNRIHLPATIQSVSAGGDFTVVGDQCMPTVATRSRCEIDLTFQPSAVGLRTGTLTVGGSFQNSPLQVALIGKAFPPHLRFWPHRLHLGKLAVGTPSATKTVTLTNPSNVPIDVSSIVSSSSDFAQTNDCVAIAPQGGQCTISVTFTPSMRGLEHATLSITDDAKRGTQIVHLAGRGE